MEIILTLPNPIENQMEFVLCDFCRIFYKIKSHNPQNIGTVQWHIKQQKCLNLKLFLV